VTLVVLVLTLTLTGCALVDGRPRAIAPRVCPDGAPIQWLQDPACGRSCGFSCLPDRWH
jgi:hypothetical protein